MNLWLKDFSNLIEGFNNYNVSGSFSLMILDIEIEVNNVKRFLVLILEEDESIMVKNNIIYNIPFEVSEKNNNIPPNPYDKDNVSNPSYETISSKHVY